MTNNGSERESGCVAFHAACRVRGRMYRVSFGIAEFQHYCLDIEGWGGEFDDLGALCVRNY